MKSLLELIPYLNGYPVWVRAIVVGLPPLYALGFVLLSIFAPTPVLAIETLRRLLATAKDTIAIDVIVRNSTSGIASVSAAEMEIYRDPRPEGGLSSASTVSATYTVEATDAAVIVQSDQDKLPQTANVVRPYANNPYTRIKLPLSQAIKAGDIDRFVILLKGENILLPEQTTLELRLDYDGTKVSAPAKISLK